MAAGLPWPGAVRPFGETDASLIFIVVLPVMPRRLSLTDLVAALRPRRNTAPS